MRYTAIMILLIFGCNPNSPKSIEYLSDVNYAFMFKSICGSDLRECHYLYIDDMVEIEKHQEEKIKKFALDYCLQKQQVVSITFSKSYVKTGKNFNKKKDALITIDIGRSNDSVYVENIHIY